jgi:crossover junction endodeoxyribonuclease RuvC
MPKKAVSTSRAHQRSPPARIVLGIDPGVAIIGYGVLEERQGQLRLLACGVIRTPANIPLAERLSQLYEDLMLLLATYHPTEAAVESLFFGRNSSTALDVAHARGIILFALNRAELPIAEYTPTHVKRLLTGHGNAKKTEVGDQVRALLGLSEVPRPDDAADAAAIGICHITSSLVVVPENSLRKRKK